MQFANYNNFNITIKDSKYFMSCVTLNTTSTCNILYYLSFGIIDHKFIIISSLASQSSQILNDISHCREGLLIQEGPRGHK